MILNVQKSVGVSESERAEVPMIQNFLKVRMINEFP